MVPDVNQYKLANSIGVKFFCVYKITTITQGHNDSH